MNIEFILTVIMFYFMLWLSTLFIMKALSVEKYDLDNGSFISKLLVLIFWFPYLLYLYLY